MFKESSPPAEVDKARVRAALARRKLVESDRAMPRLVEDLIRALTDKGVLARADLPPEAVEKLNAREELRAEVSAVETAASDAVVAKRQPS